MFQEWEEFTNSCLAEVDIYKDLINRANDIYYSRVEKLLDSIANVEVKPYMQIMALANIGFPSCLNCQPLSHGQWNGKFVIYVISYPRMNQATNLRQQ